MVSFVFSLACLPVLAAPSAAPDSARWRLDHVFASVEAFEKASAAAVVAIDALPAHRGHLDGAGALAALLKDDEAVRKQLGLLGAYATNMSASDERDDAWRGRDASVQLLWNRYQEATAWYGPELVALGKDEVEGWIASEPALTPYAYPLRSVLRRAEHVLSPGEERILALSGAVTAAPSDTFDTLLNAELPWPTLEVGDGSSVVLQPSQFTFVRSDPDRELRRAAYQAYFGALGDFEGTIGALLATQTAGHWFHAQARGYPSSVEAALAQSFVPRSIYDTLVAEVRASLPTLHRYLKLRARMLGLKDLAYSDLYVPLVESDAKFDLAESERLAMESAKPLGKDYVAAMKAGFEGGWIDVYPREGKRGGAYMDDQAYGVHPFVLLNHHDDYESASTLAHEFGHAMHSHLAMRAQPYATANYSIFLAEVASTFNEALLLSYVSSTAKTDDERLFYLGHALESLRTTYFRQAMFAEYELAIHERVEKGEALTGGELTEMYAALLRDYHGADQGVVRIEEPETHEWAYIPHFYYDFYVWQYATSLAASSLLSERVLAKDKKATEAYLALLSAGGSDDPHLLLKRAGVDLSTPAPYRAIDARMNKIMDQIEKILAKQRR